MEFYEDVSELIKDGHTELVELLVEKIEEYDNALRIISGQDEENHQRVLQSSDAQDHYWTLRQFSQMYLNEEEDMISGEILETLIELKEWVGQGTTFQVSMSEEGGGALVVSSRLITYRIQFQNEEQVAIVTEINGNEVSSLSKNTSSDPEDIKTVLNNIFNSTKSMLKSEIQVLP